MSSQSTWFCCIIIYYVVISLVYGYLTFVDWCGTMVDGNLAHFWVRRRRRKFFFPATQIPTASDFSELDFTAFFKQKASIPSQSAGCADVFLVDNVIQGHSKKELRSRVAFKFIWDETWPGQSVEVMVKWVAGSGQACIAHKDSSIVQTLDNMTYKWPDCCSMFSSFSGQERKWTWFELLCKHSTWATSGVIVNHLIPCQCERIERIDCDSKYSVT